MLFTFKRDEEGRERIHVGDVCVAQSSEGCSAWESTYKADGVDEKVLRDAIERADEAGFWDSRGDAYHVPTQTWKTMWKCNEVTVDVPVAETSTTLVVVSEGE